MNTIIVGDFSMEPMIFENGCNLFGSQFVTAHGSSDQRTADIGEAVFLLDISDHCTSYIVVFSNFIVFAWVGTDCTRIVISQFVPAVCTFIFILFFPCSPFAVIWGIPEIVIDALDCQFWVWTRAHIGVKILKDMPSFTDGNPAATVVLEGFMGGHITAPHHLVPYTVFDRSLHSLSIQKVCKERNPW